MCRGILTLGDVLGLVVRMLEETGRRVDRSSPFVDACVRFRLASVA
jgi:Flp pilus assembly CpaF family ATPase